MKSNIALALIVAASSLIAGSAHASETINNNATYRSVDLHCVSGKLNADYSDSMKDQTIRGISLAYAKFHGANIEVKGDTVTMKIEVPSWKVVCDNGGADDQMIRTFVKEQN